MTLPNFVIVGAARSGTTSLHYYLRQHPEIFMPKSVKETFFFSPLRSMSHGHGWKYFNEKWLAPERYISLFDGAQREKAVGEACVSYLYFYERTIPLLKKHLSNPKIIIVLRDPIDRAYSNFRLHRGDNLEDSSFEEALMLESARTAQNYWWGFRYTHAGLYYEQVAAYRASFGENVLVCLFEHLKADPRLFLRRIFNFLGVDPDCAINTSNIYNQAKMKAELNPSTRERLLDIFSTDILKLQALTGLNLSSWLV